MQEGKYKITCAGIRGKNFDEGCMEMEDFYLQMVKDGKLKWMCNGCKEEEEDSSENDEENEIGTSDSSFED